MSSKHARLVAAVSDAKEAQGFTWKQIATMGGVTQGTISSVINQGVTMKDERWRMICEGLGLDYDEIVADMPVATASSVSPQADCHLPHPGEGKETAAKVQQDAPVCCDTAADDGLLTIRADRDSLFLLAMYTEGRLAKDIEAGMKVDPMKLWGILDALKKIKDSTLAPE